MNLPATALVAILSALAAIHFYWAIRPQGPYDRRVIPEVDGRPVIQPSRLATAFVGVLLGGAAWICGIQGGLVDVPPSRLSSLGVSVLGGAFALRAIGEFRYVGFFKRVKGTPFAKMDTELYSPLCVLIAALCLWLLVGSSVG